MKLPVIRNSTPVLFAGFMPPAYPMPATVYTAFKRIYNKDNKVWSKKKYKFSRDNWYVVEFDTRHYVEVREWCAEQFGPHPSQPDAWSRWVHKYENKIHFRDADDALLFTLRWA